MKDESDSGIVSNSSRPAFGIFGRGSTGGFYVRYKKGRPQTAFTIDFFEAQDLPRVRGRFSRDSHD